MISTASIKTLVRFAAENIERRPPQEQAEIYEALATLLPTKHERLAAARVAFAIRETAKLQMEFSKLVLPMGNAASKSQTK